MQKNEVRSNPVIVCATLTQKWTKDLDKCLNYKTPEENTWVSFQGLWIRQWFLGYDTKAQGSEEKRIT